MPFRRTAPFLCSFLLLLPLRISLGRCSDISFSLCWFNANHGLESQSYNIWLNGTALGSLRKPGKATSLTVYPGVENQLALQCGHSIFAWTFTLHQRTKYSKIKGKVKPTVYATNTTESFLQALDPAEVFACENRTLFFHQETDFFLAIGYSTRLPLRLESRSSSMLLLSWDALTPSAPGQAHSVGLFGLELASFSLRHLETTGAPRHRFTALESCSVYVVCVEISGAGSLTCLATITDPDPPRDLQVASANSSSLSVSWDCPPNRRYSGFLLTVYHHRPQPSPGPVGKKVWVQDPPQWGVSELPPCTRLSFAVQTVCVSGAETRFSPQTSHEGNADHSNILNLAQSSSGPDWYSLTWAVGSASSVSRFKLYHDGEERASTLNTSVTVSGLRPCQRHSATVEALCGDGTVMDAQTVQVHTGPRGVSELRFLPAASEAAWIPGSDGPDVSFAFELSRADGGEPLWSGAVSEPRLPLLALQGAHLYRLSVWERCGGQGSSQRSVLDFRPESSSLQPRGRAATPGGGKLRDDPDHVIGLIVTWTLPEELQDAASESWAQMAKILQHRMDELLASMTPEVQTELLSAYPADDLELTEFLFFTSKKNKSMGDGQDPPLRLQALLPHLWSLMRNNVSIEGGVIHWPGPDLCLSGPCPQNSVCLNTLGSFSCLCAEGHYDVQAFTRRPASALPVCSDKGMFSRCLDKQLVGGVSKLYLSSRLQGALKVTLNQGQCQVNETAHFYHFKTPRDQDQCGTRRRVNESHIELQNSLSVTVEGATAGGAGGGGDRRPAVRVLWKCVYPRHYLRTALIGVNLEWLASFSVVAFNSSLQLALNMSLFRDRSFSSRYHDAVMLSPDQTLFFEVSLQTSSAFVHDIRLQVESCWATESPAPQDQVQGTFLQDGCPVDDTFSWLSQNGASQRSLFSVQMFQLPLSLPLYFHCRASVCGPQENCTTSCSGDRRVKRSVSPAEALDSRAAVVSVGPLVVTKRRASTDTSSHWAERTTVIVVVAASIGVLAVTFLFVSAVKAVMNYYERLRLK
ncbi:uncharacterized protein [Eucyclogobius newberryi]|uniref:uncharacterized protein n=1 Tax=Eucyclogobius newberryi TaxID=166745 RepID=UPI003B5942DE